MKWLTLASAVLLLADGLDAAAKKPVRRRALPKRAPATAPVSAKVRQQAAERVQKALAAAEEPLEFSGALVPLFGRLSQLEEEPESGVLSLLQLGDSHTAADEWTGRLRANLQARFGDGGQGFAFAGRPFKGYRRIGQKSAMSKGWQVRGLRDTGGDGRYGLGGAAIETARPGEFIQLETPGSAIELWYEQQPGGGRIELRDGGGAVETLSTNGERGPAFFRFDAAPGRIEAVTLDPDPVRLWGWVAVESRGVTYEALGINGAQISVIPAWDEGIWMAHLARRDPALIVLAYGTNEASNRDLTYETHKADVLAVVARIRRATPAASILIAGPPDRMQRVRDPKTRRYSWVPMPKLAAITAAQRDAARESGCAFWDWRRRMGGSGSIHTWMLAGWAQPDHAHLNAAGYQLLGDILSRDILDQYALFQRFKEQRKDPTNHGSASENPPHHRNRGQEDDHSGSGREPF